MFSTPIAKLVSMKKEESSEEGWIPFDPAPVDVLATKSRKFNKNHPGNVYFTSLVNRFSVTLTTNAMEGVRGVAEQIVNHISDERGGRFLKPRDGEINPTTCMVICRKKALGKVIHALRTAYKAHCRETGIPMSTASGNTSGDGSSEPPTKKKKVSIGSSPKSQTSTGSAAPRSKPKGRRPSFAVDSLAYKAKAGNNQKIAKPILKLISAVCNQSEMETAHRVLDMPLGGQTLESEPDVERLMRLQLRHRFAAAAEMGMSPVEFAAKLLKLWDGKLVTVKREFKPKSPPAGSSPVVFPSSTTTTTTPEEKSTPTVGLPKSAHVHSPPVSQVQLPTTGSLPSPDTAMQISITPTPKVEPSVAGVPVPSVSGDDMGAAASAPVSESSATATANTVALMPTTITTTDVPMTDAATIPPTQS